MVYVSVRGRLLLNAEAMNMTESVGNYVKRRRAPVMIPVDGGYGLFFVPVVSGESIAHKYQELLTQEALREGLPVCRLCKRGIFLKSANDNVVSYSFPNVKFPNKQVKNEKGKDVNNPNFEYEFEKQVISHCVVEDIGGFLYAPARGGRNVKRTSNFLTGYMIPVREALESVVIDPQLHSRYALGTKFVKSQEQAGQMIYYVEISSAPYTFSFDLDTRYIGTITFDAERAGELVVDKEELKKRVKAALNALAKLIIEAGFGAKRTRFLPSEEWESLVIAVSDDTWTVPSSFSKDYVERARKKVDKVSYNTILFTYPDKQLEEVVMKAVKDALGRLSKDTEQVATE